MYHSTLNDVQGRKYEVLGITTASCDANYDECNSVDLMCHLIDQLCESASEWENADGVIGITIRSSSTSYIDDYDKEWANFYAYGSVIHFLD